jgi:aminoglycoside 3-N-acetyltransferase
MSNIRSRAKAWVVRRFLAYGPDALSAALRSLEIRPGDVVMVHSSWSADNGFLGRPIDFINTIKELLGEDGLLSMVSLPYQNESSKQYLARGTPMDVRRTPSKMGLLSEVFRRGRDTRRSLSPTHPVLASGPRAEAFLEGHDSCVVPFGAGSPFDRLREWNGKILTVDAPFSTITYTHYIEDRIASSLTFPLYEEAPLPGVVVDYAGERREVPVRVLSAEANRRRREPLLIEELNAAGLIRNHRVGNTRLSLIEARPMADRVDAWVGRGGSFFPG